MKNKPGNYRPVQEMGIIKVEDELERKFFPKTYEKKNREKAMKDPKVFEERLKKKLRKCIEEK